MNINCLICKKELIKPSQYSYRQWEIRKTCDRFCAGKYRTITYKMPDKIRNKISMTKKNIYQDETKHPKWLGKNVGYSGIHLWIRKIYGSADHCEFNFIHKATRYHWANISGKYLRDINDWTQLCPTCHKQYDQILNNPTRNTFTIQNGFPLERLVR